MANIHDVTDYIITRLVEGGSSLNQLKLQKLLYYCQAWHLAHFKKPLFDGRFQAWVHGPVNRVIFDRFKDKKMLYSPMLRVDVRSDFSSERAFDPQERGLIDAVLEAYAPLSGDQLETMTHREDPWIVARKGYPPDVRCEVEIDEALMQSFYGSRTA